MNINEIVDKSDLPEEITATLWLQKSVEYDHFSFDYANEEPSEDYGYLNLAEPIEVTFKTKPRKDINNSEIGLLKDAASKIRAEAEVKCQRIDEKIQSLLCLENDK